MSDRSTLSAAASAADLAETLRVLAGRLKRKLREHGNLGELTPSQVAVLARLERDGPATVTGLARAEGMRPQSMGAIVAVLEAAGLVGGAPDASDGRQTILTLTAACRDQVAAARAARRDWLSHAIATELTAVERDQFATGLALLERIIDR